VWGREPGREAPTNLGVLTVTVAPEQFIKFPSHLPLPSRVILLIGADGRVLHLLHLSENAQYAHQGLLPELDPQLVKRWAIAPPSTSAVEAPWSPPVQPVGWKASQLRHPGESNSSAQEWQGSLARVTALGSGKEQPVRTGWVVVVGESDEGVTAPLEKMSGRFLWNGAFASLLVLVTVGAIVTLLAVRVFPHRPQRGEDLL
jgi:hypothetical protein